MTWDQLYQSHCKKRFAPPPTEAELDALEKSLGIRFPVHYRRFMHDYNGGRFNDPEFVVAGHKYGLTALYGIRASCEDAELCSPSSLAVFDDNDPVQVVPIGDTSGGDLIFIVVAADGDDYGHVILKRAFSDESFDLGDDIDELLACFAGEFG